MSKRQAINFESVGGRSDSLPRGQEEIENSEHLNSRHNSRISKAIVPAIIFSEYRESHSLYQGGQVVGNWREARWLRVGAPSEELARSVHFSQFDESTSLDERRGTTESMAVQQVESSVRTKTIVLALKSAQASLMEMNRRLRTGRQAISGVSTTRSS